MSSLLRHLASVRNRSPTPLQRVHTEGTLPHQGIYDESASSKYDLKLMQEAALAWHAGANDEWLNFARRYLMAWVRTYQPSFNPLDETGFDALIDTYGMIGPSLPVAERGQVRSYLQDWGWGYVTAITHHGQSASWINNWQSHRIKLVAMIAVATDDTPLFDKARDLFRKQIQANIVQDGTTLDFRERDALHYVVYDLQPLIQAALAARTRGENWYQWTGDNGSSLSNAMTWLVPYLTSEKRHSEFVHSTVRFDAMRAQAGLKGYLGLFDPRSAGALVWLASAFDTRSRPLAAQLAFRPPLFVSICGQ